MAFLDWTKNGRVALRVNREVRAVWMGGVYTHRASGYSAEPCVGMSDKGYHAGLIVIQPNGDASTQWAGPVVRRDHAMAEAHSAFAGWVESHEAQMDAKRQPGRAADKIRRPAPSWER